MTITMERVFQQAAALLEAGEPCILAAVVSSAGSTPRESGAKMLVRADGRIIATIGGGALEGAAIRRALSMPPGGGMEFMDFDLSQKDVQNPAAICGGKGRVLLYRLTAADLPVFRAIAAAIRERRSASFVMLKGPAAEGVFCVEENGTVVAAGQTDAALEKTLRDATVGPGMHAESDGLILYIERILFDGAVYFCGGGHVALATARVAEIAGFDSVVLEERPEFASPERFPGARAVLLESFERIPDLGITEDDYIIIVTRGHSFDRVCLEWALQTPAGYIGMIGSKTKRDLIYRQLEAEGHTKERLAEIHCPIGIPLGGSTPGEIAVSITAELIMVREKKRRQPEASVCPV